MQSIDQSWWLLFLLEFRNIPSTGCQRDGALVLNVSIGLFWGIWPALLPDHGWNLLILGTKGAQVLTVNSMKWTPGLIHELLLLGLWTLWQTRIQIQGVFWDCWHDVDGWLPKYPYLYKLVSCKSTFEGTGIPSTAGQRNSMSMDCICIIVCWQWMKIERKLWVRMLTAGGRMSVKVGTTELHDIRYSVWFQSRETVHGVLLFGLWTLKIYEFGHFASVKWSSCPTGVQFWPLMAKLWESIM